MYQNTLLKEIGCLYPISMARFSPQLLSMQAVAGIQANILKDGIKASYLEYLVHTEDLLSSTSGYS